MKRNDIILLVSILLVCALALCALFLALSGTGDTVVVTVDGEEYARLPLNTDTELLITTEDGSNLLVIKDKEAYIKEASCPDKICVRTGKASELRSIVCLPNRVSVSIEK